MALLAAPPAFAQTTLPKVDVTAPYTQLHGGYVVSSDFTLDPKMSAVIYPKEPLQKDDIVWVKTQNMKDDEYFVLQECSRPDCTMGHILRVWTKNGAIGMNYQDPNRVFIPHEGKFFMWMQRFPSSGSIPAFSGFESFSPPLVLNPSGTGEQFQVIDVEAAQEKGPEKVTTVDHNGMDFVVHYESGTALFVQRMHAAN
ncbi:MAG TPA: hypothetical protein VH082_11575 [Rudaea sp.]|jgi:hypothetical protein|nr:hypothetical protein [Rudaea sp.]